MDIRKLLARRFRLLAIFLISGLVIVGFLPNTSISALAVGGICPAVSTDLRNGGFELDPTAGSPSTLPNVPGYGEYTNICGWTSTDAGRIEVWGSGFDGMVGVQVPAYEGQYFVELNAQNPGILYQDVNTVPGQIVYWSVAHRGRTLNSTLQTDVMQVRIGSSTVAPGSLTVEASGLSATSSAWVVHRGSYVVPAGQTSTRFAFEAVSSGIGALGAGNFLDAISFTSASANVAGTLAVSHAVAEAGDELTYTLTLNNSGTANTSNLSVSLPIPPGSSYVSGSASATGVYDAANNKVVFTNPNQISQSPGVILPNGSLTLSYKVQVNTPVTHNQYVNKATITVFPHDPATFFSNIVTTAVLGDPVYVTYASQGGSSVPQATYRPGGSAVVNTLPTRAGYAFAGWDTLTGGGGTTYQSGSTLTPISDLTLYAQWTPIPVAVTYDEQGGSLVSDAVYLPGGSAVVHALPTRAGYTFAGWNTLAGGGGTTYLSGSSMTPSSDVTLYAQWTPIPVAQVATSASADLLSATGTNAGGVLSLALLLLSFGASLVLGRRKLFSWPV